MLVIVVLRRSRGELFWRECGRESSDTVKLMCTIELNEFRVVT